MVKVLNQSALGATPMRSPENANLPCETHAVHGSPPSLHSLRGTQQEVSSQGKLALHVPSSADSRAWSMLRPTAEDVPGILVDPGTVLAKNEWLRQYLCFQPYWLQEYTEKIEELPLWFWRALWHPQTFYILSLFESLASFYMWRGIHVDTPLEELEAKIENYSYWRHELEKWWETGSGEGWRLQDMRDKEYKAKLSTEEDRCSEYPTFPFPQAQLSTTEHMGSMIAYLHYEDFIIVKVDKPRQ